MRRVLSLLLALGLGASAVGCHCLQTGICDCEPPGACRGCDMYGGIYGGSNYGPPPLADAAPHGPIPVPAGQSMPHAD